MTYGRETRDTKKAVRERVNEIKIMRNFVTPKVAEFRKIPRNLTNSVIRNSAEFCGILGNSTYYTEYTCSRHVFLGDGRSSVVVTVVAQWG